MFDDYSFDQFGQNNTINNNSNGWWNDTTMPNNSNLEFESNMLDSYNQYNNIINNSYHDPYKLW